MVKANHLPICVKGTLRNTNDVVGILYPAPAAAIVSIVRPIRLNTESRLEYKMACKYN